MTTLTFTEYIEPTTTASGKTTPSKAKAGGKTYALAKSTVELVRNSLGTPLDCEVTSETKNVNGKTFTNLFVQSAKHIVAERVAEPPTISEIVATVTSSAQEGRSPTPAVPTWLPDHAKQKLIVRQSSIKAAVDLVVAGVAPAGLWETAELIETWVWDSDSAPAEKNEPRAIASQAQQIVEQMREKTADIRASYTDEDAVCPACGRKEFLRQWSGGWFCAKSKEAGVPGGCGYPPKDERLEAPVTYGEWKQRQGNIRRPDATVVSPASLPSRAR